MNDEDRLADLLLAWEDRFEHGEDVPAQDLCCECPDLVPALANQIRALKRIAWVHEVKNEINDSDHATLGHRSAREREPQMIGRYQVKKVLGKGGFGVVYLAHDEQLQRHVAVKVPHRDRMSTAEAAKSYLTEARTVANLDHPHIVPVFDVGSAEDCPCYIVSKFIEGTDLATRLKQSRFSIQDTAELIATIAEALHYAHCKGLVHRDIKPGNILLDTSGTPFVVDFGLALKDNIGHGSMYAGTPAYMSPEQIRGEGHRVDGRSDIFSLGVVFYELLVGCRPFRADSQADLAEQITTLEPRPPRQSGDGIPDELDRICLKALAKRASERYSTATEMADDLRQFLGQHVSPTPTDKQHIRIVPKGLRSFDSHDADFFLELLPGPRDREGLPDSIRFWKTRIEQTDADKRFSVGLIYGPSGCGKSSLIKAGLLPRLAKQVIAVYVEATAGDTEGCLLRGLRRQIANLPSDLGLAESLSALRQGQFLEPGQRLLLVLDQFEQWLHANQKEENTKLVQALRHCDGDRVQCIVMVRDDFWLAVSRFMGEMEAGLVQGHNMALVDLFDQRHAKKVLAAFGRAFGALPERAGDLTKEHEAFLDQAVSGLSQESKVVSVRLALFAEMVKGKPWLPATLKEVGGMEGIGITFLEETFTASTASPQNRQHQKAAQAVLKSLLPDIGTDIKGNMRSQQELLEASGYAAQSQKFDVLLRILDSELRLITPTDPEGFDTDGAPNPKTVAGQKYYQLTHDYLVHSLRDWLTRRQKETRRGRAELLLADRAALWNARPENRQLPSLRQWFQIRWLTRKESWTPTQREMMDRAFRHHAIWALASIALFAILGFAGYECHGRLQATALRDRLLDANTADVPTIVADMSSYRKWIDPLLHDAYQDAKANNEPRKQLHASLALVPVDSTQVEYLIDRLLDAEPHEIPVIREALAPHKDAFMSRLWTVVQSPEKGKESKRLRAAAALAKYDPESENWAKANAQVVNGLVMENVVFMSHWSEAFRPIKRHLLLPLSHIFRDHQPERNAERNLATSLLAEYAADQPDVMADLLMDADEKQFAAIFPKFQEHGERSLPLLTGEIARKLPPGSKDNAKEILAKRQANAAVALLKMNQPATIWALLKHSPDPRVRSYLIHRLYPMRADAGPIVKRLSEEPDITIRRALILSLGEYGENDLLLEDRKSVLSKVRGIYCTEADPDLHAASEWLLRTWNQEAWLIQINQKWAGDKKERGKRVESIEQLLSKNNEKTPPQWYVSGQGHTMVVIPGPVEFVMGSPPSEKYREDRERQHKRRIGRTFAIAAKLVSLEQYRQFDKDHSFETKYTLTEDSPAVGITWYLAAAYCNWLSKKEGIDPKHWCYEIKGKSTALKKNYLSLSGYRLPTEAEMEYAARAGALTSRYYGETEDLLPKYAWHAKNSKGQAWPMGILKPNDLGLFDVEGNVFTWCQESFKAYPAGKVGEAIEDKEDNSAFVPRQDRVVRCGSFGNSASYIRSATRNSHVPGTRLGALGFRVARTMPLDSVHALPPSTEP